VTVLNESFLFASLIWGSIGTGYLIYGWRQKALVPFLGGFALVVISYFVGSWLLMSCLSIIAMILVHVLIRRGF
jgi:hypothetical protein